MRDGANHISLTVQQRAASVARLDTFVSSMTLPGTL
jgi:hypothetical protein